MHVVNIEILKNLTVGDHVIKLGDRCPSYIHFVDKINQTVSFSELFVIFKGDYRNPVKINHRLVVGTPITFEEITNGKWLIYQQ
jgi:hypothetical protein